MLLGYWIGSPHYHTATSAVNKEFSLQHISNDFYGALPLKIIMSNVVNSGTHNICHTDKLFGTKIRSV